MARKREPVEPNPGQRLLGPALKRLRGASAERSNLALDILTGRTADPARDEPLVVPSPREPSFTHQRGTTSAPRRRGTVTARTVYLSEQDVTDIDFIVGAWRRRVHKRVSRSEVLRQAIESLRDAVELGAAPRVLDRHREESRRDG